MLAEHIEHTLQRRLRMVRWIVGTDAGTPSRKPPARVITSA
jgi:hypothetical protein